MAQKLDYYGGNKLLKAAGVQLQYTDEQVLEYMKCKKDPIYFIENYVKIVHVDHGLVDFELWDFQKKIVNTMHNNRFTIAKLPRQCGKSTTIVSYILWVVLFHKQQNIAILANKSSSAMSILGRLQKSYMNLPFWLQQGVLEWNKKSIALENGSKILAGSTAGDAARGDTYNMIMLDEFAFVPRNVADEFITSVYPTISSGKTTKIIMVSTPNGMNLFYKYWHDALEKRNKYIPVEAHWSEVPGRDAHWEQEQRMNLGDEKFAQEFETEFLGSTHTLISPSKLKEIVWKEPVKIYETGLKVYEPPQPNHFYVTVVDTSEGQGQDYSAFSIIDVTESPYKQVAVFRSPNISPSEYPEIVYYASKYYNGSYVMVETNGIGSQVVDILYNDLEYEYVFSTTAQGRGGQKLSTGSGKGTKHGVKVTEALKRIACAQLKSLVENDILIVNDYDTIAEFTSYVRSKKTFAAEPGCNDDLVSTLVLFAWLTTQQYFKDLADSDTRKQLAEDQRARVRQEMTPDFHFPKDPESGDVVVDKDGTTWQVVDSNFGFLFK